MEGVDEGGREEAVCSCQSYLPSVLRLVQLPGALSSLLFFYYHNHHYYCYHYSYQTMMIFVGIFFTAILERGSRGMHCSRVLLCLKPGLIQGRVTS